MGNGELNMYLLNTIFIRKRIEEISGTDKCRHNEWHTFPYAEAEEAIVRVSGVDPDIVSEVINQGAYTEDEDFVISVAEALHAKVEEVATLLPDGEMTGVNGFTQEEVSYHHGKMIQMQDNILEWSKEDAEGRGTNDE